MARAGAALLALLLALAAAGCGGEEGVEEGATVVVYTEAGLCDGASRQAGRVESADGSVELRVACLPDPRRAGGVELATVGANARRASEDSTTIAYLGEPGAPARFSTPILEAAGIASITGTSGDQAMQQIVDAVAESNSRSLRDEIRKTLESP